MQHTLKTAISSVKTRHTFLSKNWVYRTALRFTVASSVISFALIAWRYRSLPPQIPLWQTRPWGDDQLAHPLWLLILPITGLLWHAVNTVVGMYTLSEYRTFNQILFAGSVFVNGLSLIIVIRIMILVS